MAALKEPSHINTHWQPNSFLIEMRPRTEYASLFVDCTSNRTSKKSNGNEVEVVKVYEQSLELIEDLEGFSFLKATLNDYFFIY